MSHERSSVREVRWIGRLDRIVVHDADEQVRAAASALLRGAGFDAREHEGEASLEEEGAVAVLIDADAIVAHEGRVLGLAPGAGCVLVGVSHDVGALDLDLYDFALAKPYATADLPRVLRALIDVAREDDEIDAASGLATAG